MSEMDLNNKIVLVTGGASGIGLASGEELLRNGVRYLAILDLATSNGEELAKKLNAEFGKDRVIFIACDVTKEKEFEAGFAETVEKFSGLDIVINNAGILNASQWELLININFTGVVRGTLLGLQYMGKNRGGKGGVIVNIASIAGLDPEPSYPVYSGTKHAIVGFSRSVGLPYHYDKSGVRVLTMCPGVTETPLLSQEMSGLMDFMDPEENISPLGHYSSQKVDSVAQAVVHIIRSAKTGTVWVSEGGEPVHEVLIPHRFAMKAPTNDQE